MESRKMALMNPFAGVENRYMDKGGVGKGGQRNWRAALTYIHDHV